MTACPSSQVGSAALSPGLHHPRHSAPSASRSPQLDAARPAKAVRGPSLSIHPRCFFQVLVPCKGSLSSNVQSTCQFESYILVPVEEHFQTLNGKVFISFWVTLSHSLSAWEVGGVGRRAGRPASHPVPSVLSDGSDTHRQQQPCGVGGDTSHEQGLARPLPGTGRVG